MGLTNFSEDARDLAGTRAVHRILITKDSGKRQDFPTGSRRDTQEGKGRYDLFSPLADERLAAVFERGAAKYGDRNWEKGQPIMRYVDSLRRHLNQIVRRQTDEDHEGQALWNAYALVHTLVAIERGLLPPELDDRPRYEPRPDFAALAASVIEPQSVTFPPGSVTFAPPRSDTNAQRPSDAPTCKPPLCDCAARISRRNAAIAGGF